MSPRETEEHDASPQLLSVVTVWSQANINSSGPVEYHRPSPAPLESFCNGSKPVILAPYWWEMGGALILSQLQNQHISVISESGGLVGATGHDTYNVYRHNKCPNTFERGFAHCCR